MTATIALGLAAAAISGLVSLGLILRFLWCVYERGGPSHLATAATALRKVYDPRWLDKITGILPNRKSSDTEDKEETDDLNGGAGEAAAIEGT
jgi:hypothetical protein